MTDSRYEKFQEDVTVVVIGNFNPSIFHPDWFAKLNLIRSEEAAAATIEILRPDITIFKTDWFSLQVLQDRFSVTCIDSAMYLPMRDLILGIFQVLEHTPVKAFGLNTNTQYKIDDDEYWHRVGHHYTPKESWTTILKNPGMRTLVVEGQLEDSTAKAVQIRLEPSSLTTGLYIHINHHYVMDEDSLPTGTSQLVKLVQQDWVKFTKYRELAASQIFKCVDGAEK